SSACNGILTLAIEQLFADSLINRQDSFKGTPLFGDTFVNYNPNWVVSPDTALAQINNGQYEVMATQSGNDLVRISNKSVAGATPVQDFVVAVAFSLKPLETASYFAVRFRVSDDENTYYELRWLPSSKCTLELWQAVSGTLTKETD